MIAFLLKTVPVANPERYQVNAKGIVCMLLILLFLSETDDITVENELIPALLINFNVYEDILARIIAMEIIFLEIVAGFWPIGQPAQVLVLE